jgi:AcrR family transcriptional regulator
MTDAAVQTAPNADIPERVLAGAEQCFVRFGVAKTSVEDIARAAGVSRKTVYRYFSGGRDQVVLTVLLRRGAPGYNRIRAVMAAAPTVTEAVVNGVVETVQAIRADEVWALLFGADEAGRTSAIAGRSEALFAATRASLVPVFERACAEGALRADIDIDDATEWVMRIIASFVTVDVPRRRTDAELAQLLRSFLAPSFFTSV